ncbi:MAG: hypothetical protein ACI8W7_004833 [Gammaproteobacteria bacterium]|jgi:hypothetical protein
MTQETKIRWQSGASLVTDEAVRTRLITVSLEDIDLVEVRRPLLAGAALFAGATTLLGLRFADVLTFTEFAMLAGAGWLSLGASLVIARLKLHSYSIDGVAITLPIWRANAMRRAIDTALAKRRPRRRARSRRST